MTTTTYYNLNIVEGTDIVNPLIVDNPNYEKIDEAMHNNAVAGVTLATEIANATVHAITRENSDCAVIRFIATSEWRSGDTATVDGVPVTALLPSGETLPDGAYVINANVLCILTGTNLTIYAERKKAENANEIAFNNTTVGAELVRLDNEINTVNSNLINSKVYTHTLYGTVPTHAYSYALGGYEGEISLTNLTGWNDSLLNKILSINVVACYFSTNHACLGTVAFKTDTNGFIINASNEGNYFLTVDLILRDDLA